MRNTIAITVEGVLRKIHGGAVIPQGKDLYQALAQVAQLVLLTDDPKEQVEHWLAAESMHEHSQVYVPDVIQRDMMTLPEAREDAINKARAWGYPIDMVIEADPDVARRLLQRGYSVMLMCWAQYSLPSWRPDYVHTPTPWDTLAKQVADEAYMKAQDKRLEK